MAKFSGMLVALGVWSMASTASAGPNLIQNGDFEAGTISPWITSGLVNMTTMIPYFGGGSPAANGAWMVTFNDGDRTANGTISQSFATVAGAQYKVSFDYGTNNGDGQQITAQASDTSGTLASLAAVSAVGSIALNPYGFSFQASSSQTTLSFLDDPANFTYSTDGLLDNVVVSLVAAVPEPATAVLLLGGIGLMAVGQRRLLRAARV